MINTMYYSFRTKMRLCADNDQNGVDTKGITIFSLLFFQKQRKQTG